MTTSRERVRARRRPMTTSREPTKPSMKCEVCGQPMRLTRTMPVASRHECYEFWECVACGHTHLRATSLKRDAS
jgi:hypothetical protein